MTQKIRIALLLVLLAACGDNKPAPPDAPPPADAGVDGR